MACILPHTSCAAATAVNIEKQSAYYVIKIADQFFASFLTGYWCGFQSLAKMLPTLHADELFVFLRPSKLLVEFSP